MFQDEPDASLDDVKDAAPDAPARDVSLDAAVLRSLVAFRDLGVVSSRWASLTQPVAERERVRIEALREVLVDGPVTLLNEATI